MFKHIFTVAALTITLLGSSSPQARAADAQANSGPLAGGVSMDNANAQAQLMPALTQLDKFGMHCGSLPTKSIPAQIIDVAPMSQAYKSGLKAGDTILSMANGKEDYSITIRRAGQLYGVTLRGHASNHPFPEMEIAELRHAGVMQQATPNCWFEAGLSALADSPEGPRAIQDMITAAPYGYDVKFPGVQNTIPVTEMQMKASKVADPAKWACVLERAEISVYPANNPGWQVNTNGIPGVKVGLEMLTGRPVNFVRPETLSQLELFDLFTRLRGANKPITLATKSPGEHHQDIQPMTPNHAYSVVDFDRASGLLTLRNPYGQEQKDGLGVVDRVSKDEIRVDLPTVRTFFRFIAYPS